MDGQRTHGRYVAMTNNAKQAILDALIETCKADLGSNAKAFAEAFQMLVNADIQVKMAEWQTRECDCHECRGNEDFPQEIG